MRASIREVSLCFLTLTIMLLSAFAPHISAQTAVATVGVGNNAQGLAYDFGRGEVFVDNAGDGTVSVISDTTNAVVATVPVTSPYGPVSAAYDSAKGEVFVVNIGSGTVSVISDATNTATTTVTGTGGGSNQGSDGIVFDSGKGEVFVANGGWGGGNTVSVISDTTNTVVATIVVGTAPAGLAYDSGKGEVFVAATDGTVSVISDTTNTVVATASVGGPATALAYDFGLGEVFVGHGPTSPSVGAVSVISDTTNSVVATLAVGDDPVAVAYDSGTGEIFVGNHYSNTVSVISDTSNTIVTTVGSVAPSSVAYDFGLGEIFVGNSNGNSVSVISDGTRGSSLSTTTIAVGAGPYVPAFDSVKGEVFVPNAGADAVTIINDNTNAILATVGVGSNPVAAAYDFGKGEVFVTNHHANTVSVISDASNAVIANINVGVTPFGVAYDIGKGEVFVANVYENLGPGTVSVISDTTNTVVATIGVGMRPFGVAYDFTKGEVFVANNEGASVSVISDATNMVVATIGVAIHPVAVAYDHVMGEVFVASVSGTVSIISDATNTVVGTISVGGNPSWATYDSGTRQVFVTDTAANAVNVISDISNSVVTTVGVGSNPAGLAYDPNRGEVFVSNFHDNTVSVISDAPPSTGGPTGPKSFSISLVAPTSNPARVKWAAQIATAFQAVGIDAHLRYTTFSDMSALSFGCSSNCNESYSQGGFDGIFVGIGGGTSLPDFGTQNIVTYRGAFASDYAPLGSNFNFYHNSTYNALALQYNGQFDAAARVPIAQKMVAIVAQDRPDLVILQPAEVYGVANYINPWGNNNNESSSTANRDFQHWILSSGQNAINIAETGALTAANQWATVSSNSYYNQYLTNPTGASLEELDGRTFSYNNALATSIAPSADHLTWTVNFLAHNFQDGVPVTANDYLFSVMGNIITDVGSANAGVLNRLLGANGAGECGCSQVQFTYLNGTSDYVVNGAYSHGTAPAGFTATSVWTALGATSFKFTLTDAYLFTDPILTGIGAQPMHIFEGMPFASWATSPFETLQNTPYVYHWNPSTYGGNGTATAYGPIGDGPYYYHGYDPVSQTGSLVKWNGYWNATGLQALGEFNAQVIHVVHIAAKDAALTAFAGGTVNFLDSNYQLNPADIAVVSANGGHGTERSSPVSGWQELTLQMSNPVWGTGTATPLGQADPSRAAFAARMVREALSFLIPRGSIIQNILHGEASPGITQFCTCFKFAYPLGITPDPYDLLKATALLALAGYGTSLTSSTVSLQTTTTTFDQSASTGAVVTLSGYSPSQVGTQVTVATSVFSGQPSGTGVVALSGTAYFDVFVTGLTQGTATVCLPDSVGGSTIQYWSGTQWVTASNISFPGSSICGDIPVSALTGTPVLIGHVSAYRTCAVPNTGGANLQSVNLEYCNLVGFNLAGDNLIGADLKFANLQQANLKGANLQGADLRYAKAAGANLNGANLQSSNLQGANLLGATAQGANFQGSNLQGASLQKGDFTSSNFQGANLKNSNLSYGKFSYCNFQGANTQGAIITGAVFTGAKNPP